jgi:hypothetical protein
MSGEKRHQVKARYQPIHKVTVHDLRAMYAVFRRYYDNISLEQFIEDMSGKTGIFVLRDDNENRIVGFSTLTSKKLRMGRRSVTGVFSGDTILESEYWGNRSLQVAFYVRMVLERFKRPFSPVFWLLISKGYKTYLLLANNFSRYYPDVEGRFDWLEPYVDAYCRTLFPHAYCPDRKLLDFGEGSTHLKGEVTPITREMRERHPKIRFFEECNPSWQRGTELPCIGLVGYRDVVRFPLLLLAKSWRRLRAGSAEVRYE